MADVVLDHVTKLYPGNIEAVKDNCLRIRDQEFVVLVGPSGCGKSTTLRMIAGLEEVSRGEIRIDGKLVNDVAPKDRDIAMVFQNYALYPHMSVRDNLAFGLKLRGLPKREIQARVQEAAAMLELETYLDRKPKALSGGQRQRVALGRAIVRKPKVFLFDEPLSNLDAKLRHQMRVEIAKLHQRLRTTMIYVTHDQVEAMTMGTQIVVMNEGRIQQADRPLQVYNRPLNMFVAGFIGSPTMNFFRGTVHRGVFRSGRFGVPVREVLKDALEGREVIVGVRPESLQTGIPEGGQPAGCAAGEVELVEPMGAECHVHVCDGDKVFVARTRPDVEWTVGRPVSFWFSPVSAHYFDPATEAALS